MKCFSIRIHPLHLLVESKIKIIGIDGASGSGKTWLSKKLQKDFSFPAVSVDEFIEENADSYISFIDYRKLMKAIAHKHEGGRPIVIEGVCLLKVFDKLNIHQQILIYVKRIDDSGQWVAGDEILFDRDQTLEKAMENIGKWSRSGGGKLDRELVEYHHSYDPIQNASLVFGKREIE